jgi:hypothetical protein
MYGTLPPWQHRIKAENPQKYPFQILERHGIKTKEREKVNF